MIEFNLFLSPKANNRFQNPDDTIFLKKEIDTIQIINQTYLGNFEHNFYGDSAPESLNIIWKKHLGSGKTIVGKGSRTWSGAGWTGQPLMIREKEKKFIT